MSEQELQLSKLSVNVAVLMYKPSLVTTISETLQGVARDKWSDHAFELQGIAYHLQRERRASSYQLPALRH